MNEILRIACMWYNKKRPAERHTIFRRPVNQNTIHKTRCDSDDHPLRKAAGSAAEVIET